MPVKKVTLEELYERNVNFFLLSYTKLKLLGFNIATHTNIRDVSPYDTISFSIRHNIYGYQSQETFVKGCHKDLSNMSAFKYDIEQIVPF